MDYYRCENPDCGFVAEEEPDVCPRCGGTFFHALEEEELTAGDWVTLGNCAVDEKRQTDAPGLLSAGGGHGRLPGHDQSGLVPGGRRGRGGGPQAGGAAVRPGGRPGSTCRP